MAQKDKMIIVDVDEEGNPTISVVGVKGPSCKALTKRLEERLGMVETDTDTPEMKEIEHEQSNVQRRSAGK